jgi:hypothetical protein
MSSIFDLFWEMPIIREVSPSKNQNFRIRLGDLEPYLSDVMEIDPTEIEHLLIDVERNEDRINNSDLKCPIILAVQEGDYALIIDGQHRTVKALREGLKISAKKLNLDIAPEIFKLFFGRKSRN